MSLGDLKITRYSRRDNPVNSKDAPKQARERKNAGELILCVIF